MGAAVIEFVFMLTHHDRTVDRPLAVYEQIRGCGLRYVGFKDVGASVTELREVCGQAHADGLEVMLEVVSVSKDDELRSIAAAADIGVDWVLGGTHPVDGLAALAGAKARYCPFPGTVVGHPSVLLGEIGEIAESARQITALDGVYGLDLLAYRHPSADAAALTSAVVQASSDRRRIGCLAGPDQGARHGRRMGVHDRRRHLRGQASRRPVGRRPDQAGPGGRRPARDAARTPASRPAGRMSGRETRSCLPCSSRSIRAAHLAGAWCSTPGWSRSRSRADR
jgi:hypothetical protein